MRFAVCQYTTPRLSFAECLVACRAGGAEGIGIVAALMDGDPAEDLARFRASGLQATFCIPAVNSPFPVPLDTGERDPRVRTELMCDAIRDMAGYEPACILLGTGGFAHRGTAVASLRRAAAVAADLGLQVALEPLHASLGPEWGSLTDLPGTLRLLEDMEAPNAGVLFDVWHLWDTPDVREHLAGAVDRVAGVHVDDWRSPTRSWADRVLPGDGVADVAGLLAILRDGGYDGWLELEVFSDDGLMGEDFPDSLWREDPVELIRRAGERTRALWEQQVTA